METFDFYFGLKLGKLLFSHTDKLSQTLQSEKMSAVSSKRLAMLTVETISDLRNSESFDALYDLCLEEFRRLSSSKNLSRRGSEKNPNTSGCIILKETKADPKRITPPPLVITIESNSTKPLMF